MGTKSLTKDKPKIKCFVLADDHRWHYLSNNIYNFEQVIDSYLNLLSSSEKENNYQIKSIYLTEQEYRQFQIEINDPKKMNTRKKLRLV